MTSTTNEQVGAFYENFPYPPKRGDALSLGAILPSDLGAIGQYIYAGKLPRHRPFRVLVAGGGTGDAVVSLARQAAGLGMDLRLNYIDLSEASLGVARERAGKLGMDTSGFKRAPIESLLDEEPGRFDYVDLCGVINHVADQEIALRAICHSLTDTGGLGVMAYGASGRSGIYQIQSALSILGVAKDDDGVSSVRALLAGIPNNHPHATNPNIGDTDQLHDIEIADRYLNPRDKAFSVHDLTALCAGAGLRIQGFFPPLVYDPSALVRDPGLRERIEGLSREDKWHLGELMVGTLHKHVFHAVRAESPIDPQDVYSASNSRLIRRNIDLKELAEGFRTRGGQGSIEFSYENQNRSMGVRLNQVELDVLIALADGHRFGDIPRILPDQPVDDQTKAIKRMAHMLHAVGAAFIGSTD